MGTDSGSAISSEPQAKRNLGVLAMLGAGFGWSLAGLFIKLVDWNPAAIAATRSLIASLFTLAIIKKPRFTFSGPQIGAAIANAATMILFVTANKTTTAANAIILQYICPIYTAVLGLLLLKERIRIEHWVSFALVGVGMLILFSGQGGTANLLGDILAILSGVSFAFYFVFMRMQKNGSPMESILLSHWIVAVVGFGACFFFPAPVFSLQSCLALLVLGVVQLGVSGLLLAYGIKRVQAGTAMILAVIEPVFNPIWVFVVTGEAPGINTLIGGALIIAAITMAGFVGARRGKK